MLKTLTILLVKASAEKPSPASSECRKKLKRLYHVMVSDVELQGAFS